MITREKAKEMLDAEKERRAKYYSVIVDGNRHNLGKSIITKKEPVNEAKCQSICDNLVSQFGIEISCIEVRMDEWDFDNIDVGDYMAFLHNDGGLPMLLDQSAYYWPKTKRLKILQYGQVLYDSDCA